MKLAGANKRKIREGKKLSCFTFMTRNAMKEYMPKNEQKKNNIAADDDIIIIVMDGD